MTDNLSASPTINGTWEGFYDHDNKSYSERNFPITATILLEGKILRGTMIDGVTNFVDLYQKIVDAHEGRLSIKARLYAKSILDRFPDYRIESSLPENSRLEGTVIGDRIRFTKTYLGDYSIQGSSSAGWVPIRKIADHRVEYEGTLSPDRLAIEGRWTIPARGFFGRFRRAQATGGFQLFKKDPSEA